MQTMRDGGMRRFRRSLFRIFQEKNQDSSIQYRWEEKLASEDDERFTAYFFFFSISDLCSVDNLKLIVSFPCHWKYSICFGRCCSWFLDCKTYHGCGSYGWNYFVDWNCGKQCHCLTGLYSAGKKGNSRQEAIQKLAVFVYVRFY